MNYIEFPNLFGGARLEISRTAFNVFGINIYWYSIIVVVGIILAVGYAMQQSDKYGMIADKVFDAAFAGLIGGSLGARLYYVILADKSYNFITFFSDIRDGGLAIYGGVIGGVLVSFVFMKLRKINILPVLDLAGQGFLLGIGIGRWGNFINQEAYGTAVGSDYIFGMTGDRIVREAGQSLVHPCFLYESLWCILGFILLHFYAKKLRTFDGEIFLLFAFWYGAGRAFNEQLRTDSLMLGDFKISQVLAVITATLALGAYIFLKVKVKKSENYKMFKDTEQSVNLAAAFNEKLRLDKEKAEAKKALRKNETAPSILGDDSDDDNVGDAPLRVPQDEPEPYEDENIAIGSDIPSEEENNNDENS